MNFDLRFAIGSRLAALALLSTFNLQPSTVFAQGALTPPGAPAPTMKTLDQIEARTPIASVPFTITQPGSYYLTTNVSVTAGDAIVIATNNVTLDLSGFTISSTAASPMGAGILLDGSLSDVTILNGHICGGVTNNAGVYGGRGFANGIYFPGILPINVAVSRVSVSGCLNHGIYFNTMYYGSCVLVEACLVQTVGSNGITASLVMQSSVKDCGGSGILADQASDCWVQSNAGAGITASIVQNCCGTSIGSHGIVAGLAQNCYGDSVGGAGVVVNATAQNCSGSSFNSTGLYAQSAQDCSGFSTAGSGLDGYTALNCYGESSSASKFGITTAIAHSSYGRNYGSGTGLYGSLTAMGCTGRAYSGTGLSANIANSCFGFTDTNGVAQAVTHKYNMP